jgi:hypothetical protein
MQSFNPSSRINRQKIEITASVYSLSRRGITRLDSFLEESYHSNTKNERKCLL